MNNMQQNKFEEKSETTEITTKIRNNVTNKHKT